MTHRTKSHAMCVAAAMALMTLSPVSAFAYSGQTAHPEDRVVTDQNQSNRAPRGRVSGRQNRNQQQQQPVAPALPTPEENLAAAQQLFAANSVPCQMTEANLRGQTPDTRSMYEVVCANGFGYLSLTGLAASTDEAGQPKPAIEPIFIECIEAQVTHDRAVAASAEAAPPPKCDLPANQNFIQIFAAMSAEAGIACTVDQGTIVGRKGKTSVYEIGCDGADGYRINRAGEGWEVASCLELANANVSCDFTTKPEQLATVKTWLAANEKTAACDINNVRYMGSNPNGSFYEAACNGAEGFITRLDAAKAIQEVYPCSEAEKIGDGCKLTAAAPQNNTSPAA
ncbi:hypothetical protein WEU32_09540 [Brevundimonas sp. BH3]|uniref:hypothetical protein n=1 Tax=Brevundimonas sp. BH3 TaxID=3133089 RepID=UPI00324D595B